MEIYIIITFLLIIVLAVFGKPLFTVIAATALANWLFFAINNDMPILNMLMIVPQEISGIAKMPLIYSIPLFTFAGYVLAASNASKRLVRLTKVSLGWLPGGLAIVTLFTCAFFTAFTGASGVTIVALGGFLLPALMSEGYKEKYSLGLVTSSGGLGLLFPPSLPLILFGVVSQKPIIDSLFIGGAIPGFLQLIILSVFAMIIGSRFKIKTNKFSFTELRDAFWDIKWEIPLPILLFAGIYLGKLTVSDAAAFTAVYILVVELFITKDVKIKQMPGIIKESMVLVGAIIIILSVSLAATNYVIFQEVPDKIFDAIKGVITNKWTFLIVLNLFLLVVGCFMDIFSAIVVVVPLILPIAYEYNINMIHLGIIFITNLEIGYLTPPVGMNLFISSIRFSKSIVTIYKSVVPFILLGIFTLAIITYFPKLTIWFIEPPALQSSWEYDTGDGYIDRINIYSGGIYTRASGSFMDLSVNAPYKGRYIVEKDKIKLMSADGYELYRYELYNDGERLFVELIESSVPELENAESQIDSGINDFDGMEDWSFDDNETISGVVVELPDSRFYKNTINPVIKRRAGEFMGRWDSIVESYSYAFSFQNEVSIDRAGRTGKARVLIKKNGSLSFTFSGIPYVLDQSAYDILLNDEFISTDDKNIIKDYFKIDIVPSIISNDDINAFDLDDIGLNKYYKRDIHNSWIIKINSINDGEQIDRIKEILDSRNYTKITYSLDHNIEYDDVIILSYISNQYGYNIPLIFQKDYIFRLDYKIEGDKLTLHNNDILIELNREVID